MEDYRRLIEAVDLEDLYVLDFNSSRRITLEFPLQLKHELTIGHPDISKTEISVNATLTLDATEKSVDEADVNIEVTWRLVYSFTDLNPLELEEELVLRFINTNVPLNVWPYARSAVTAATAQMGLPPLVLETYKVFG